MQALAEGNTNAATVIAQNYLAYMQERTSYFQTLAITELGGDVDHILLSHLNRINADHLGTLLDWYVAQVWTFITFEQALDHPVFPALNFMKVPAVCPKLKESLVARAIKERRPPKSEHLSNG
jgi:hypothetical protein